MHLTKSLLFAYFAGQATSIQRQTVAEWLAQPGHRELYFSWLEEWERQQPQYVPDLDRALGTYRQRLDDWDAGVTVPPEAVLPELAGLNTIAAASAPIGTPGSFRLGRIVMGQSILRWAALWLLIVGVGYWGWQQFGYQSYTTATAQVRVVHLPDGSRVTLNAQSNLKIPRLGYGWLSRRVALRGEAVFDVRHLPSQQSFVVTTPAGLEVHVLGTEFSVSTRAQQTQVVLNRGRVRLHNTRSAANLTLLPGQQAVLNSAGRLTRRRLEPTKTFAAWRTHRFTFNNTPLSEVARQLRGAFGVTVRFNDEAVASRVVTGTFQADSPDELLTALAELLDLRVSEQQTDYTLHSSVNTQ